MIVSTRIKSNSYKDSVALMRIAEKLLSDPAILRATLVMGTPANKDILQEAGLLAAGAAAAAPSDLIVVLESREHTAIAAAWGLVNVLLSAAAPAAGAARREIAARTIAMGRVRLDAANIAQISVPGPYAGAEALKAVKSGLNVFLFSDNVPLAQEREIKLLARRKGLIVMGPDCGTAIIGGVPLGFANVVRRGRIGLVGASGTGLQEVSSQIHRMGEGVSHALGTGSRDVQAGIGGISMMMAFDLLAADEQTRVIGIVSKPPAPGVMRDIVAHAGKAGKPVVLLFLGGGTPALPQNVHTAASLYGCASACAALARGADIAATPLAENAAAAAVSRAKHAPGANYLRGLFTGGTFCSEAQLLLQARGMHCWSNAPLDASRALAVAGKSREHTLLDLGEAGYTAGKPHPMIDPSTRIARIAQEAADSQTAVLLLDVVLGYGAHADPAGALHGAITRAKSRRELPVIAFVCGTEQDPQVRSLQEARLAQAGCIVAASSTEAVQLAAALIA